MTSIYDLKSRFQALLRPICTRLVGLGLTANQVTLAALVMSLAAGGLVLSWPRSRLPLLLMPAVLFARMALNALDGMMAREHGMKTPLGAILNELGDVTADAGLYLPLAAVPGVPGGLIVAVVVLAIVSEMTGVVGVQIGASRRYDGPMGKSDRAFAFGALALLLGLGLRPGSWLRWLLAGIAALLIITIFNRARRALGEVAA